MKMNFYKYHGAGNDFILVDNRKLFFEAANISLISFLCNRRFGIGADGLMLLQNHGETDFEMRYFNSDGPEASMCGNGGRCIAALASRLGIVHGKTTFKAVDGFHEAEIMDKGEVNLKMSDVNSVQFVGTDYFLDTGSPHYVRFVDNIDETDVFNEGRSIRYSDLFREKGTNVNFVMDENSRLTVYTYERGVEDETLACGTGITASALCAALRRGLEKGSLPVRAKGGNLEVSFVKIREGFTNIWLKGPTALVFEGDIDV